MDIALPYVKGNILEEKFKNFNIMETLEALYTSISANVKISSKLLDLINHILNGKLKMQLELKNIDNNFTELNKMINRLVFAIIVAALVVGSSLVINANVGFKLYGVSVLGLAGYLGAAIAGFWLLISIIKSGRL
jgi:ubiquinone biosynthesis protein